jgi:hypothetical protein
LHPWLCRPFDYRQPLLTDAVPRRYSMIMRLSTIAGDILDDAVSIPRGMAIKALDVPGVRLPGSEADTTQDFLMADSPAFAAPNAKKFVSNLKMLAKTTDRAEGLKKAFHRPSWCRDRRRKRRRRERDAEGYWRTPGRSYPGSHVLFAGPDQIRQLHCKNVRLRHRQRSLPP